MGSSMEAEISEKLPQEQVGQVENLRIQELRELLRGVTWHQFLGIKLDEELRPRSTRDPIGSRVEYRGCLFIVRYGAFLRTMNLAILAQGVIVSMTRVQRDPFRGSSSHERLITGSLEGRRGDWDDDRYLLIADFIEAEIPKCLRYRDGGPLSIHDLVIRE